MSTDKVSVHGSWASRWVFILAATGSAVGLGSIWKFPYMVGVYGGGAFVLMFLACIALIGVPVMLAEMSLIALSLQMSVVFVTLHHIARIVLSVLIAKLGARWVARAKS